MRLKLLYPFIAVSLLLPAAIGCGRSDIRKARAGLSAGATGNSDTILVQPLGDFPLSKANIIAAQIRQLLPAVIIAKAMPLPESAWYAPRKRYRADSLLQYLSGIAGKRYTVIGLTKKDISTTKGAVADWGVMGLGERPGNTCVVSTFRLSEIAGSAQLYKICIHELGHTAGLPHCPEKTCFMRDAEGGNPVDEETGFCASCRDFLMAKGRRFSK